MSLVPSTNALTFWSVNTTFTASGVTYRALSDIVLKYGNKVKEEYTTGTDVPYYGTGGYHGEADVMSLGSSDNLLYVLANPVSGIVPTVGMNFQEQDTTNTMTSRIWYTSGKITEFEKRWSKDNVVEWKFKMIITGHPVIS